MSTELENKATWDKVREFMQARAGVVLTQEQSYLLESRLNRVYKRNGFESLSGFVDEATRRHGSDTLASELLDAMTTHETYFFRDRNFWEALRKEHLPRLLGGPEAHQSLRVWCAACSSGQEPYTLAMILNEDWPQLRGRVEILGTDIARGVLDKARTGTYTSFEVNRGLAAPQLLRHFQQVPGGFKVRPHLSDMVTWEEHNLLAPHATPAVGKYHLILCRNVLIYFAREDRERVCKKLLRYVTKDGLLGLGSTERGPKHSRSKTGWHTPARLTARLKRRSI